MTDCPHIKSCKKRSAGKACLHWLSFPMRREDDPINGPALIQQDCAYNWQARFAFQQCHQLTGNQAAVESFRNEMIARYDKTLALATAKRKLTHADG